MALRVLAIASFPCELRAKLSSRLAADFRTFALRTVVQKDR
jgi:hypothetical protein